IDDSYDQDKLVLLAETWQSAIDKFSDAPELAKNYYIKSEDIDFDEDAKEAISTDDAKTLFNAFLNKLEEVDEIDADFAKSVMKTIQKETGIKGKNLWFPVRAAVTGSVHGPDLSNAFLIMGKNLVKDRLEYARDNF